MPKYGHGGTPGTPFMTIFGIYVSPQIPSIEKFQVYGGLWTPGGIPSFCSSNFPSNGTGIMSGDPFSTPVMTILQNVNIWNKYDSPHSQWLDLSQRMLG